MLSKEKIKEIKELVGQSKTKKALDSLIAEGQEEARILLANFAKAQSDGDMDFITQEEERVIVSRTNWAILAILDGKPLPKSDNDRADSLPFKPPLWLAIGVLGLEILIGLLGELMPQKFKDVIEKYLGGEAYFTYIWLTLLACTVVVFIHLYLKYERLLSTQGAYKERESGNLIVANYQAAVNAQRTLGQRIFYFFFKARQRDVDFIRAIGLTTSEEEKIIEALAVYAPLHFSKTLQGNHEKLDLSCYLFQNLKNIAQKSLNTEGSRFLILAESGCGKTTILYNVFCAFAKSFPHQPIIIRELRKGYADILEMKADDQKQTILLLDGLDEDWNTLQNPKERFKELAKKLDNFKAVVVSARTQLFKSHDEELEDSAAITFKHLYLDFLSDEDIEQFLRQKFKVKRGFQARFNKKGAAQLQEAQTFIKKNERFETLRRPFLLQNIDAFLSEEPTTHRFTFEYQIYEMLVQHWMKREATSVVDRVVTDKDVVQTEKDFRQKLTTFSKGLATELFTHQQDYVSIETHEYQNWVNRYWEGTDKILAQSHSFLSRDAEDYFHFAHTAIFEYFLAEAAFDCLIDEKEWRYRIAENGEQKDKHLMSFDFYNQMCWYRLANLKKDLEKNVSDDAGCWAFIDDRHGSYQVYKDLFNTYIQPIDAVPIRAFLMGHLANLRAVAHQLTHDDTLFVVLTEVILNKLDASNMRLRLIEQLLTCAEKLTNEQKISLTKMETSACDKPLGGLPPALLWLFNDTKDKGAYTFIHPFLFQYCQLARFTGLVQKTTKDSFQTVTTPKRSFIPPLSIFFDLENKWLEQRLFFDEINLWNDETGSQNLINALPLHQLRTQKDVYLQKNKLSIHQLRQVLNWLPKTFYSLDVRNNALTDYLTEPELPQNARFYMRLEGNPMTNAQKAECLDALRPYLHTETVIDFEKTLGRGLLPNMITIQGGTFTMGDNDPLTPAEIEAGLTEKDNYAHEVTVNSFKMAQFLVTVRQFAEFMQDPTKPKYDTDAEKEGWSWVFSDESKETWVKKEGVTWLCNAKGEPLLPTEFEHPVIHVSWFDAIAYCNWLSAKQDLTPVYDTSHSEDIKINTEANGYRLPTEAEWEFAAGNGAKHTKYSWGNDAPLGKFGGNVRDETYNTYIKNNHAHFTGASYIFEDYETDFVFTSPVGSFKPNEFKLFDMTGNVNEWCSDWYAANFDNNIFAENSERSHRVNRGGGWRHGAVRCRVTYRFRDAPSYRGNNLGFRLVFSFQ